MSGDGKWIEGLKPGLRVEEAARRVLVPRLGAVAAWLPEAVARGDDDPEAVHQLRVATRRAGAAVGLFDAALPGKFARKARKVLRRLRRAAGEARDADVFAAGLDAWAADQPPDVRPGVDFLHGTVEAGRERAMDHLAREAAACASPLRRLAANAADAPRAPRGDAPRRLGDLAAADLEGRFADLAAAADHAAADPGDYGRLHEVRIVGKRLRYAVEVFADCFGPALRLELYPAVERLQSVLGDANDSHVAAGRLADLTRHLDARRPAGWARWRPAVAALVAHHEARLPEQRRLFAEWLDAWGPLAARGLPGRDAAAGATPAPA